MKYLFLIFFICDSLFGREIGFDEIVESAINNSHRIKIKEIDVQIEKAKYDELYSGVFPQLALSYNTEYNKNLDSARTNQVSVGGVTMDAKTQYEHSISLGLNYKVYDFGVMSKQLVSAEYDIQIKKIEQRNEEIQLGLEVLEYYTKAQSKEQEVYFKKERLRLLNEMYNLKRRLYQTGYESILSVSQNAIDIIDLQNEIEVAQTDFIESIKILNKLSCMNIDPINTSLLPVKLLTIKENKCFDEIPQGMEYKNKINQKLVQIKLLEDSQFPVVSMYANYYTYGSDLSSFSNAMDDIKRNSQNIGLVLKWVLFEGLKYDSESKKMGLELQKLKSEYELVKSEFENQIVIGKDKINSLQTINQQEIIAFNETVQQKNYTKRLKEQGEASLNDNLKVDIEENQRKSTMAINKIKLIKEQKIVELKQYSCAK